MDTIDEPDDLPSDCTGAILLFAVCMTILALLAIRSGVLKADSLESFLKSVETHLDTKRKELRT